ncbi:hypothetical protein E0W68_10295 [Flavobacterium salilacus subsp. salilacus]|nr:hypothetical protein [Flavobacterium salilacus]KAF2518119.1 hypothetical protein E0W68_10295 [Flavobacterium salilacus subsp. salilacus]
MTVFYFLVIGICAVGGFWGTYKLSQLLGKDDEIKHQHPIPDVMLIDFDIEFSFDDLTTKTILEKVYAKTYMHAGDIKTVDNLPVTGFFSESLFNISSQARENYALNENIYNILKNIDVLGSMYSKNNETTLSFTGNNSEIIIDPSSTNNIIPKTNEAKFGVYTYNKESNTFKGKVINFQILIDCYSQSQYLYDLERIKYMFTAGEKIKIKNIDNILIKTRKTRYFRLKNIDKKENGFYNAELIRSLV